MNRLVHVEFHRPGQGAVLYAEQLVLERPDVRVLLLEAYPGDDVTYQGRVILPRGAPVIWFVFSDAWYDVGRFHDGSLGTTGWYTNFREPIVIAGRRWIVRDLFLDLWQPSAGEPVWLDEDQLAAAEASGLIEPALGERVRAERNAVQALLRRDAWPPAVAREMDLKAIARLALPAHRNDTGRIVPPT